MENLEEKKRVLREEIKRKKEQLEQIKERLEKQDKELEEKLNDPKFLEWRAERASKKFCKDKPCFICGYRSPLGFDNECYAYGKQFLCLCGVCYDARPKEITYEDDSTEIDFSQWNEILDKRGYELWIEYSPNGQEIGKLYVTKKGEKPSCLQ